MGFGKNFVVEIELKWKRKMRMREIRKQRHKRNA